MKVVTRFALVTALVAAVAFAAATPAAAGGITIQIGGYGGHYGGRHDKGRHRGYRTYGQHRRHDRRRRQHRYVHGFSSHSGQGGCHQVQKFIPDGYGGGTNVGGTMCYDHYGNGYVVPGSRFVIAHY